MRAKPSQAHGRSGLCVGLSLTARERRALFFLATLERVIVLPKHRHLKGGALVLGEFRRYGLLLFVMQLPDPISMAAKGIFLSHSPFKLPRTPRLARVFLVQKKRHALCSCSRIPFSPRFNFPPASACHAIHIVHPDTHMHRWTA